MGEDIFNFVLSDINGIPALPVFIGNYLLDLLSTFFPIFMLLSSFVMVYIGFTRGSGDWKQTAQQIAPTAVSMAVIMGLLSMKTPYTSRDGAGLQGDFWQDVNSYTVVEMMNTFLGFGNIFADALTHKIIYGSITVTDGDVNNYNGYFPTVLQAIIDKDNTKDTRKFLMSSAERQDILEEINKNNQEITNDSRIIIKNLSVLGVLQDYKKPRGDNKENLGNTAAAYNHLFKQNYFVPYRAKSGSDMGIFNDAAFTYAKPNFPNEGTSGADLVSEVDREALIKAQKEFEGFQGYAYVPNVGLSNFEIDDFTGPYDDMESSSSDKIKKLNIAKRLESFYNDSSKTILEPLHGPKAEQTFAYMHPGNFIQELNMLNTIKKMVVNYKSIYDLYTEEITNIENKIKQAKDTSEIKALENSLNEFKSQQSQISGQASNIAGLYKEFLDVLNSFGVKEKADETFIASLNSITSEGKYESLKTNYFNQAELDALKDKVQNSSPDILEMSWFSMDGGSSKARKNVDTLMPILDNLMRKKAYISLVMYDKFKDILKDDTLFQAKLGFNSTSPYSKLFLPTQQQNSLIYLDEEKAKILDKYAIEDKKVGDVLTDEIDKNVITVGSDIKNKTVIHWTDLGKYYSTFKNLYSPMITNIMVLQAVNSNDQMKAASLAKFMAEQEPSHKVDRLLNAAGIYAGASLVSATANFGINKIIGQQTEALKSKDKSSFGSFFDVIKIVGGMYFAILFVNVILPAFIWMFVIITYYVEMSIYVAVFPIGFMFMIFQSYRQSLHQYINMLLGFILMPIVLVSMYFIVLYIDMLLPMFFKQFLPFFVNSHELSNAFSLAFGTSESPLNTIMGSVIEIGKDVIDMAGTNETDLATMIGNFIYTLLSMLMSVLLLLTFFRANEYMSKILNVSTVGMDSFQGKETINKFGAFDKSGLTASLSGR